MVDGNAVSKHNEEIHENARFWNRKPQLRAVYRQFYSQLATHLPAGVSGSIVECGSGLGNLKSVVPDCITTDLFPNPWIDQVENVFELSFPDESVAALILFDVFHHLEYPGTALAEIRRVLAPGGRLILFEPGMGFFGRWVLGLFHHEPLALRQRIEWDAPEGWSPKRVRYYAAQGNAWRIFVRGEFNERLEGWRIVHRGFLAALPWLASGGFRGPQLIPNRLFGAVEAMDRSLASLSRLLASRLVVVLEKGRES